MRWPHRSPKSEAVFAVDYRGISVPQAAELRTKLRDADASFRIVKNTLTERAADKAGAEALKELLEGPTAMTFVRGDAAAAAKALSDFRRASGGTLLEFKGGWMNGAPLGAAGDRSHRQAAVARRALRPPRRHGRVAAHRPRDRAWAGLIGGLARQLQLIADQGLVSGGAGAGRAGRGGRGACGGGARRRGAGSRGARGRGRTRAGGRSACGRRDSPRH